MGGGIEPDKPAHAGAIYVGEVVHKRARPKIHSLRYKVFSLLVDLDEVEAMAKQFRFFSVNKWNLFSLKFSDFGARDGCNPAKFARNRAVLAGIGHKVSRVRMLFYPRILGYAFNPLTVYYLEDANGAPVMLIYEVRNTFGEHHFYQQVVDARADGEIMHNAKKAFYVSPFNTLEGNYRFSVKPPAETVFNGITLSTDRGAVLTAWFSGARREFSDSMIAKLSLAYPLMTIKIIAGIHWEAFKLWLKGVPHTLGLRKDLHAGTQEVSAKELDAGRGRYE